MGYGLLIGKPHRYVNSHPGKLSLLLSAGREMSNSESAVTFCGWEVKTGMARSVDARVGGCNYSFIRTIPERVRGKLS